MAVPLRDVTQSFQGPDYKEVYYSISVSVANTTNMDSEAKQGKINDKQRKRFDFSMVISSFNLLLFVAMFVRCEIVFREFFSQENRLSSLQQEMDRLSGLVPGKNDC